MARALVKNASNPNPRNLIINGAMDFWQRRTASVAGPGSPQVLLADRWQIEIGGAGAVAFQQSTSVPNTDFKYSIQGTQTGAGDTSHRLWQRIEAATIREYVGKTMTYSFWFKTTLALTTFDYSLYVPVTTEDIWPSENTAATNILSSSLSTVAVGAWQRLSFSFVVPTTASRGLVVGLFPVCPSNATVTNFTGLMLTEGPSAPADFYRTGDNLQAELAICQRYYEKSYDPDTIPGTLTQASQVYAGCRANSATNIDPGPAVIFRVTKRASPTLAFWNPNTLNDPGFRWNNGAQIANPSINSSGLNSFATHYTGSSGLTPNSSYIVSGHWTADAEL
jgi:hypothetical protein